MLTLKPFECGTTILTDAEQDVLLSWSLLAMLTLHQIQIPNPTSSNLTEIVGEVGRKVQPFVDQVIAMSRSGTSIEKLLEMQEASREARTLSNGMREVMPAVLEWRADRDNGAHAPQFTHCDAHGLRH